MLNVKTSTQYTTKKNNNNMNEYTIKINIPFPKVFNKSHRQRNSIFNTD